MDYQTIFYSVLIAFMVVHCAVFIFFGERKLNVPQMIFKSFFILEAIVATEFLIYSCVYIDFDKEDALMILSFFVAYVTIGASYVGLKHWVVMPDEVYYMVVNSAKKLVTDEEVFDGHIFVDGREVYVYLEDEQFYKKAEKGMVIKVKYLEYRDYIIRVKPA